MSTMKKVVTTVAAVLLFVVVTIVFVFMLKDSLPSMSWLGKDVEEVVYYRPAATEAPEQVTEATVPPQTEPAQTIPPETVPEEITERIQYEQIPLYDQTQYPDIRYRRGTLASNGSNITSLAMVASYLTGYEYLPDELAACFADFIGNSMQWLEHASDALQLPWKRAENIDVAIQALRDGKIAIVLMNEKSVFMQAQHYIVFTGMSEDGKILVHDPYSPNYSKWNLKDLLKKGFERKDLSGKYSGAWIYDPQAMPEEPFHYVKPENTDEFRYPGVELTQEEKDLMAQLLCSEAESEPFEGQQAIAEVILNRLVADNFQSTIKSVIYAEGQFPSVSNLYLAQPTHTQYEAIERALYGPYVVPIDVVFFSKFAVNDNVWGTIGSHTFCYQW